MAKASKDAGEVAPDAMRPTMTAPDHKESEPEIATADAAGQPVESRLREAEKQLRIVLEAIGKGAPADA